MASQVPPQRAVAYTYKVSLVSQANTKLMQTSVTLATGDVTWSKAGAAFANVGTLPTEVSTTGVLVGTLTTTETDCDWGVLRFRDASGDQWCETLLVIEFASKLINDLATSASISALNNLSAAQVNSEVDTAISDAALATAANLATVAGYIDTEIATLVTNVASILADTGTDGVVLSSAVQNAIADAVLSRAVSNVQDSADTTSLAALILAAFESSISGTTWTIRKTGGTTFATKSVTVDDTADPITGVT